MTLRKSLILLSLLALATNAHAGIFASLFGRVKGATARMTPQPMLTICELALANLNEHSPYQVKLPEHLARTVHAREVSEHLARYAVKDAVDTFGIDRILHDDMKAELKAASEEGRLPQKILVDGAPKYAFNPSRLRGADVGTLFVAAWEILNNQTIVSEASRFKLVGRINSVVAQDPAGFLARWSQIERR